MSENPNDGGPAFPTDHSSDPEYTNMQGGMSLRDHFAGLAMQALITARTQTTKYHDNGGTVESQTDTNLSLTDEPSDEPLGLSADAYWIADAMIHTRKLKGTQ